MHWRFILPERNSDPMLARSCVTESLLVLAATLTFMVTKPVLTHAANWTKLSPATSPSARSYPAMAYDPVSKKVVLFGGYGAGGFLNDTWTFNGKTWTKVKTPVTPPVRYMSSMGFDKRSGKLVMFGGLYSTGLRRDTWLWDGATSTWTQIQMKPSPPAAAGPMLFSDPHSGGAIMFGGFNIFKTIPNLHDTWRWTGTTWRKLHPATSPYGRGWGVATPDPLRKNVVVTGGNGDTIRTDNTWTWDSKNWTQLFPATQIQQVIGAGSAFDADLKMVVVFGGFAGNDINQTWSWSGINWVQMHPKKVPSPREGMGMAYDPVTHQVVLFGGELGTVKTLFGDTWAFSGR